MQVREQNTIITATHPVKPLELSDVNFYSSADHTHLQARTKYLRKTLVFM